MEVFAEVKAISDIARHLGYARQTVSRWHSVWEKHGTQGLSLGTPGPAPKLSDEHLEQIQRALIEGPRAHGYATELWTLDKIADLVEEQTGLDCCVSTVWRLLRRLNWSSQKPERRARERKGDSPSTHTVLSDRNCGKRREDAEIADEESLVEILSHWQDARNATQTGIDWLFTTADARMKLRRLYPKTTFN